MTKKFRNVTRRVLILSNGKMLKPLDVCECGSSDNQRLVDRGFLVEVPAVQKRSKKMTKNPEEDMKDN